MGNSREEGVFGEAEVSVGDPVYAVQRDTVDPLTVQHHKVVLADQKGSVCQDHHTLPFVVPVVYPEQRTHTHTHTHTHNQEQKIRRPEDLSVTGAEPQRTITS